MTTLTIGSPNPYNENSLNPTGGISVINIQTKRGGNINIGSASTNNNMSISLQAGQNAIQIGGGSATTGLINIGSNITGYTNTVNICNIYLELLQIF